MMGLSGTFVNQREGMLPLEDIAVGLSRMPRFGGQTISRWSVADHLLAGMHWSSWHTPVADAPGVELFFGLHDAHEALTSDVVTDFKTWSLRRLQKRLDVRLCRSLGLDPRWLWTPLMKRLDKLMLLAEASIVAPPATYHRIIREQGGWTAQHTHRAAVGAVLANVQDAAQAAEAWLTRINTLLERVRK